MKKIEILLTVTLTLIVYFIMIFFFRGLSRDFNLDWTGKTGPLGDTLGGLFSPIIGFFSIYYIYETYKAQREQIEDQRHQHHISRITDIIYLQLERINESIRSQTFLFSELGINEQGKVQGYAGLYTLNETIGRLAVLPELNQEEIPIRLEKFMVDNLIQLIEVYESITKAGKILENLLENTNLNSKQSDDLRNLLGWNVGDILKKNIAEIHKCMELLEKRSNYLDGVYYNDVRRKKLDKLIGEAHTFFKTDSE